MHHDDIPDHVWDMLPENASYIKEIMKFSGYQTITSAIKLEDEAERKKNV